ncbi:hypothetical protein RND71_005743 [Anisodus tanguticus]|uniref:Uncharacterized protein n=1 Tax=Anisodus tanguticus TaxID=243964 RepID=A0AAE1SUT9_9SOLA|nr:hypothetical protein RND71_005743 [Anisodus tanguticus]
MGTYLEPCRVILQITKDMTEESLSWHSLLEFDILDGLVQLNLLKVSWRQLKLLVVQ